MDKFSGGLEKSKNNQESESVFKTYSGSDFIKEIYKGGRFLKDKRFFDFEKGGSFRYLNVSDVVRNQQNYYFPTVKIGDKIIALVQLEKAPSYEGENTYYKSFCSVDSEFQGKGYASEVLEETFQFASKYNMKLINSSYNGEGELKLQKKNLELAQKYNVDFIDGKRSF